MSYGDMRYVLHNIRWARVGPRSGLLRRRRWQQRIKVIAQAESIEVAAQLLASATMYPDEVVYLYDREQHGRPVGVKYGWSYKP